MNIFSCLFQISFLIVCCILSYSLVTGLPRTVKKCGISHVEARTIGGSPAEHGEFPWVVSIHYNVYGFNHICGGSILNENWILTAAHCVPSTDTRKYQIFAGIHRLSDLAIVTAQKYRVSRIVVHGKYNETIKSHDIALIRTKVPIDIEYSDGYVNAICLPKKRKVDPTGWAIVAGWGRIEEKAFGLSEVLNEVDVPLVPRKNCTRVYARFTQYEGIKPWNLCAGRTNRDACQNDSGGPLMQPNWNGTYTLIGVVQHGAGCGRKGYPGVYAKVAYYLPWLERVMG